MFSGPTLFCWGLAATNAAALGAFAAQWRPLISSRGVLPANVKAEAWDVKLKQRLPDASRIQRCWAAFWQHRSLVAVFGASDAVLVGLFALGFAGVASLVAGILPSVGALACYLAYSSLHSVSQPWLGLQMDVAISECNLVFAVLYALSWASPSAWVIAQRWLVWRTMVACGIAKWSGGDPSWRVFRDGGSAMSYHYWTQPLPNPLSRMAHFAPQWFHAFETAMTYVVEIGVPLLYVAPSPLLRWLSFILTVGFNAAIGELVGLPRCLRQLHSTAQSLTLMINTHTILRGVLTCRLHWKLWPPASPYHHRGHSRGRGRPRQLRHEAGTCRGALRLAPQHLRHLSTSGSFAGSVYLHYRSLGAYMRVRGPQPPPASAHVPRLGDGNRAAAVLEPGGVVVGESHSMGAL